MVEGEKSQLSQLYSDRMLTFLQLLHSEFNLEHCWFYTFLQLCHAPCAQEFTPSTSFAPMPLFEILAQAKHTRGLSQWHTHTVVAKMSP